MYKLPWNTFCNYYNKKSYTRSIKKVICVLFIFVDGQYIIKGFRQKPFAFANPLSFASEPFTGTLSR